MASLDRNFLIELAQKLAQLYSSVEDSRPVAADVADLNVTTIKFDFRGLFNWLNVLSEAHRQSVDGSLLHKLLERTLQDFPNERVILQAFEIDWSQEGVGKLIVDTISALELELQRKLEGLLKIASETWNADRDPPSALLQAKYGVVPFLFRKDELADLQAWCDDESLAKVRLYTGVGGLGKTRLLLEFCTAQKTKGWKTGFLVAEQAEKMLEGAWSSFLMQGAPLLIVLDYAETQTKELKPLLSEVYKRFKTLTHKVRIVLLARAKGEWWDQLRNTADDTGYLLRGRSTSMVELQPVANEQTTRQVLYDASITKFAVALDRSIPRTPSIDLSVEQFDRTLFVLMAALHSFDDLTLSQQEGEELVEQTLNRERDFWRKQLEAKGFAQGSEAYLDEGHIQGLENVMALVTLGTWITDAEQAVELLGQDANLADLSVVRRKSIAEMLHTFYGDETWISPLQPDLLGEYLALHVLQNNKKIVEAAFDEKTPKDAQERGLLVLSRLCTWQPEEGTKLLKEVLTGRDYLFPSAVPGALKTGGPIVEILTKLLQRQPNFEVAAQIENLIPENTLKLRSFAALCAEQAVQGARKQKADLEPKKHNMFQNLFRKLTFRAKPDSSHTDSTTLVTLAERLIKLGNRLNAIEKRTEGIKVALEGAAIYDALAKVSPDTFLPEIAISCLAVAKQLGDLGELEGATTLLGEAYKIFLKLTGVDYRYTYFLLLSFRDLALRANEMRQEGYYEMLIISAANLRSWVESASSASLELAFTLTKLASILSEQKERVLAYFKEGETGDYAKMVESILSNETLKMTYKEILKLQEEYKKPDAALKAIHEAVSIYRKLLKKNPDAFLPDLAKALNIEGNVIAKFYSECLQYVYTIPPLLILMYGPLVDKHQVREVARKVTQEAVNICHDLVEINSEAFTPLLAESLNNLGYRLSDLGLKEQALEKVTEAFKLLTSAYIQEPRAFEKLITQIRDHYFVLLGELGQDCDGELIKFFEQKLHDLKGISLEV